MILEALLVLTTALPRPEAGLEAARRRVAALSWPALESAAPIGPPVFSATVRAVSNWRDEAGTSLRPASLALVVKYASSDPGFVARCVKLNNYWCIKRAGWTGELGGDAEGHTGFATAADGADAAAVLLRRYYREFGRRSALAIVRRWAPAECAAPRVAAAPRAPATPAISAALAPGGLGRTLRARFLAARARPVARSLAQPAPRSAAAPSAGGAGGLRVQPWSARARLAGHPRAASRVAARPLPTLKPVADIAAGILPPASAGAQTPMPSAPAATQMAHRRVGEPPPSPAIRRTVRPASASGAADPAALLAPDRLVAESAALPSIVAGLPGGSLLDLRVPPPLCTNDETRIRNYAARIAASVGLKPDDDLGLFAQDGTATERLALVMRAMSQVELGSLHATPALIAAAVARLSLRPAAATASAAATMPAPLAR